MHLQSLRRVNILGIWNIKPSLALAVFPILSSLIYKHLNLNLRFELVTFFFYSVLGEFPLLRVLL